MDVVIIGGSIAGLCIGVTLKTLRQVKSITILERNAPDQIEDQGAGIRVAAEVEEFLAKYAGTMTADYSLPIEVYRFLGSKGAVLHSIDLEANFATTWIQLYRVLRRAFLSGSHDEDTHTPACSYRYSCVVRDVDDHGSDVEVLFTNEADIGETLSAEIVIGADGASSTVRDITIPGTQRTYAGYVLQRGLVPVEDLSESALEVLNKSATMSWTSDSQILSYTVPASKSTSPTEDGGRALLNWGWYAMKNDDELAELMTGANGVRHTFTLPQGRMKPALAEQIRARATIDLPPQFAEVVTKTTSPFVQVITDSLASGNVAYDGRVLLVGDAAAGQRPHSGSAVTQAVLHAVLLRRFIQGSISLQTWSEETYAISSGLVSGGKDLGAVCMSTTMEPNGKAVAYAGKFTALQVLLGTKWKQFSADD